MDLRFEPKTHRYRDTSTGRFVRYSEVLKVVDGEVLRLETRLKGHARSLISGKIDIGEFQTRMAQSLKESHIRMGMLGAGGEKAMTPQQYGNLGQGLKKQYTYLYKFGKDLQNKNLSDKQILARAAQYAQSSNTAFHQAEFTARGKVGFYAKRLLDPQAQHCAECLIHQRLNWTPIALITPIGVNCTCGGRCRCRMVYRKI